MLTMAHYPNCPYCDNQALSIVDLDINGVLLKGIQCNNPKCCRYVGFFKDYDNTLKELEDAIDNLKSEIEDLESELSRIH